MSRAEEVASRCLRSVLTSLSVGSPIDPSDEFDELQSALERLLPEILRQSYPFWRHESLDGFRLAVARKSAPEEAELIGLCLLISNQTWTQFHLRVRPSPHEDSIQWLDCRLGQPGDGAGGMLCLPHDSIAVSKLLYSVGERPDSIEWVYRSTRMPPEPAA